MTFRTRLIFITLILLGAAALRLIDLTRLPPGLNNEEIIQISISEAVQTGTIATFYNVGDPLGGRSGLHGIVLAAARGLFGNGLLPLRALSVFLSLICTALLYVLVRRLFGSTAGLISAGVAASTLWPILMARATTADALLFTLTLATLIALVNALHIRHMVEPDPPITQAYTMLGLSTALTVYAGWVGLFMPLLLAVYLMYLIGTRQPVSRRVLGFAGFALLVATIAGIPYLSFTLRSFALSGVSRLWALRPPDVQSALASVIDVLSSLFANGDQGIARNLPSTALLHPALFFLFLVGVVGAVRQFRRPNMALMLIVLGIGLVADMWAAAEVSFSEQIIALPAIFALIGLGADTVIGEVRGWFRWRVWGIVVGVVVIGLVGLNFANGYRLLFTEWAARPELTPVYHARLGRIATYLDRTPDGLSTSLCTFALDRTEALKPGEIPGAAKPDPALIRLMLHRPNVDLRFANCVAGLVLTRGGAWQRLAYADPEAPHNVAPPLQKWLAVTTPIPVPGLPADAVKFVDAEQIVADEFGQVIQSRAWWPDSVGGGETVTLPIRMGGYLTFEGYRIAPEGPYKPGDVLTLATYWRADGIQVPGLSLFAHVLRNPNTEPALQNDILSLDSSLLRDRDVFIQVITIPLPPDFPPGDYYLSVGAYSRVTNQRLPLFDATTERGDRLFLERIVVQ